MKFLMFVLIVFVLNEVTADAGDVTDVPIVSVSANITTVPVQTSANKHRKAFLSSNSSGTLVLSRLGHPKNGNENANVNGTHKLDQHEWIKGKQVATEKNNNLQKGVRIHNSSNLNFSTVPSATSLLIPTTDNTTLINPTTTSDTTTRIVTTTPTDTTNNSI
jgi:hypothetical protein